MVWPPLACQMSETSTLPPLVVPQCEMISSPWYEVRTAAWAAWVSRWAARALAGRLASCGGAFGLPVGPVLAGADAVISCGDALAAVWPLHAVTRKPGTATASAAVSSTGGRASRRRVTEQLNANTPTSRLRGVRVGHRRPG